ncbi:MAG: hypothetical protein HYZ43_02050 [Flavobacteriia bacterium]|nr:hypothetical protein [Flavobacteriia bacterium]
MKPSTFYNKEQVAIFTRFMFKPIKTGKKWTSPQFGLHHAMGTGSFDRKDEHRIMDVVNGISQLTQLPFQSMDKGYYEVGIIADKLIILNTSGFGLGLFYNYGYYSVPQAEKNLTVKFSVSFVI